jgi:uncharacterized protein DUF932
MTIYTNTARFDSGRALTEDELRKLAPSVFAVTAHSSRSERFAPIPTFDVLQALTREGFFPVGAKQSVARLDDRRTHTKHLIRLRRFDKVSEYSVGGTICEILLKNANDGTSAYELLAGLFRILCMNSLVSQISTVDSLKVRHTGSPQDVANKVIEGTYRVLGEAKKALVAPAAWSGLALDAGERIAFAEAAHMLRFGDADGETHTPVKPHQLLGVRRQADNARDLWTTFNVVQENVIRGGLKAVSVDGPRRRRVTTRAVNGIDQDVKLNRALFTLAAKLAELKGQPLPV